MQSEINSLRIKCINFNEIFSVLVKIMKKVESGVDLARMNSNWKVGSKISSIVDWRGRLLGALHHGSSPHTFSRAYLMSISLHDLWEVWLLLMRSERKCIGHAEEKRKETNKGHSANESWTKEILVEAKSK